MQTINMMNMSGGIFTFLKQNATKYALNVIIFIIVSAFFIYVYIILRRDKNNCKKLDTKMNTNIVPLLKNPKINLSTTTLNQTFIKTAYNCCCSGQFKNDYVNYCALINCAKQGVRALDFTVYSLKGNPVIAASTLQSNEYKETTVECSTMSLTLAAGALFERLFDRARSLLVDAAAAEVGLLLVNERCSSE